MKLLRGPDPACSLVTAAVDRSFFAPVKGIFVILCIFARQQSGRCTFLQLYAWVELLPTTLC